MLDFNFNNLYIRKRKVKDEVKTIDEEKRKSSSPLCQFIDCLNKTNMIR